MPERIYVGAKALVRDALGEKIRAKIIADLEIGTINSVRTAAMYIFNGSLFPADLVALAEGPLSDPIVQDYTINRTFCESFDWMVEVGFLPGVTDNAGTHRKRGGHYRPGQELSRGFLGAHRHAVFLFRKYLQEEHRADRRGNPRQLAHPDHKDLLEGRMAQGAYQGFPARRWWSTRTRRRCFAKSTCSVRRRWLVAISKNGMLALSLDEMKCIKAHFTR